MVNGKNLKLCITNAGVESQSAAINSAEVHYVGVVNI